MTRRHRFGSPGMAARLALGLASLAGVTFLVGALAWVAGRRATEDIGLGEPVRRPASAASAQAQADLLRMQLHLHGYLLLGDQEDVAQYRAARRSFEVEMAALHATSEGLEGEDARAVRALQDDGHAWTQLAQQLLELHDNPLKVAAGDGKPAHEDLDLYRTRAAPQADALLGRLAELTARQQGRLASSLAHAHTRLSWVEVIVAVADALAVAIAVVMAGAFRRSVVLPLRRMTSVAERVTAGDLEARADVESGDEVGALARGINSMTERLSETIRHLESIFAEAQDAKAAAEVANRAKSRFLASMSHELRTPLNAVLGYAQILRSEPGLSEFQANRLEKIRSGGEHLLAMINDVLDLSRLEAGKVELQPLPVNLTGLLRAVCGAVCPTAECKGLSFSCDLAPDLPDAVLVDGRRLEQVLLNLLDNAVKFTERGHVSLRARRLEAGDSSRARVQFEVADSGIGIVPERLPMLFRPFEQGSDAERQRGGAGLGMAIGQRIVTMMGGNIEVVSQPGRGSLFRFQIDVELVASAIASHARGRDDEPAAIWRRILVVGAATARDAGLRERLVACGFELTHADGVASAVKQAREQRPDLLLVGVGAAGPEEAAVIQRLREDAALRGIALIALSPTAAPSELADSGADALLREPLDVAALAAAIGELRRSRSQGTPMAPADGGVDDAARAMVVPDAQELELLHELARIGNMRSIGERAEHLAALDPDYQPFARRLRDLAQRFQSRAILEWISGLRRSGSTG